MEGEFAGEELRKEVSAYLYHEFHVAESELIQTAS